MSSEVGKPIVIKSSQMELRLERCMEVSRDRVGNGQGRQEKWVEQRCGGRRGKGRLEPAAR